MNLWVDVVHHETHAPLFAVCRRLKFKYFACFCIRSSMHNHKNWMFSTPWTLHEIARSLLNHFLFAHWVWKCLKEGCCTIFAYTRHAVLFRDARGRHNFRANYVHLPKNTQKMLKTELGNCSPFFAIRQLISHSQFFFSPGCKQWEKIMWFWEKKINKHVK